MAAPLIRLDDIVVSYDTRRALQVDTLSVHAGEILAIIGPNGAGKSTLLRILGLLQRPTQGTVSFNGALVTRRATLAIRRRLASVFQEPLLLNQSVFDNVALGLKLRGARHSFLVQRVGSWLERLAIDHLQQRAVHSLSGGEAQRTSLARALVLEPEVLLLDEPFAALDPPSRETLLLDLEMILRETGITTVFITHERQEALTLGDRVVVLLEGEVVQTGTPWQVFSQPATEAVAQFVGAGLNLPGVVTSTYRGMVLVDSPVGNIEAPAELPCGTRVTLCLRPEDLTLLPGTREPLPSSARNILSGTIQRIVPWGGQCRVTVDCGAPLTALVTRQSVEDLALQVGQQVLVRFKASSVHVIRHHA